MIARLKPPSDSTQVGLVILLTIFYLKGISSTPSGLIQIKEKEESLKNKAFISQPQPESLDHSLLETILSELNGFNRSISVLINQDKKKDKDIEELKIKVAKLENEEHAGTKRCKIDESPIHAVNDKNERVDKIDESDSGRHRKAARLIPLTLLENKNKAEIPDTMKNGMPTTCRDLNIIGHTLKGFYLVRNPDISTIETVFCDFKESQYSTHGEKRIGHVEIKSSPGIFFHAQRNKSFSSTTGVLNFQFARINKGGAMNLFTGVFTAPKRGIYHFSFMALKGWSSSDAGVILRLNEIRKISASYARESFIGSILTMSLEATLKLEPGDKIDLYKNVGGALMEGEETHKHHYMTQFTGQLLQEELNF